MSVKADASVTIDRPPADVFAVLIDVLHQPEWSKAAGQILNVSENPAKLGTTWTQTTRFVGRDVEVHVKVITYEANRAFGIEVDKPFPAKGLWLLEPTTGGTRVIQTSEFEPGGFFGLAAPVLRKALKDVMSRDNQDLKTRVEAR